LDGIIEVDGGIVYGGGGEYISIGGTDDYIEFQGTLGSDNTDLRIDLDGTRPYLDSPTDSYVGFLDSLYMSNLNIEAVNTLKYNTVLDLYESTDRADLLAVKGGGTSWMGFQIDYSSTGKWSFMGDEDDVGIYDDTNSEWVFLYDENAGMNMYYNGGVKLQTVSAGASVTGNLVVSANVTALAYYYSSDKLLKKEVSILKDSLDKIKQLEGVGFNWKDTGEASMGLIAQDVEKVYPELVGSYEAFNETTNETQTYKTVQYGNLVAPLIESVKELDEKDSELKKRIEEQDKRIQDLEKELNELKSLILERSN
jgi:chaperonin cofactor prefoldin